MYIQKERKRESVCERERDKESETKRESDMVRDLFDLLRDQIVTWGRVDVAVAYRNKNSCTARENLAEFRRFSS